MNISRVISLTAILVGIGAVSCMSHPGDMVEREMTAEDFAASLTPNATKPRDLVPHEEFTAQWLSLDEGRKGVLREMADTLINVGHVSDEQQSEGRLYPIEVSQ